MKPECFGSDLFDAQEACDTCCVWGQCSVAHTENRKNANKKGKDTDMNYQVQKTFSVCAAHRLMDHPGACKKLHGHNYNITVHLGANALDTGGMVVDFGKVKTTVGGCINEMYDHKTILQNGDPMVSLLLAASCPMVDLTIMLTAPTAENMAKDVFRTMQQLCKHHWEGTVVVMQVDVEETCNSIASYKE